MSEATTSPAGRRPTVPRLFLVKLPLEPSLTLLLRELVLF